MAVARFKDLVLEAADHQRLADWWCKVLGYERHTPRFGEDWPPGWPVPIRDPAGHGPTIWITPVEEGEEDAGPRRDRGRIHLDVWGDTAELLALGAAMVKPRDEGTGWDTLRDPEGNEFCVFPPPPEMPVRLGVR
ncbi:VOC family protein [Streptomyces sp. YIM 98790]|uniref:VOC family protein n=1 Tax=Streptomyces sp. YIM 98790 TaxID=2689077 RepID=UPI00140E364F|nr:VOC family protein [Streptomyces sp. YIM 98790]